MSPPNKGVGTSTEDAVRDALAQLAQDRYLPRTATKLAELAGVGRATLYRAFDARPELRDSFNSLAGQSPAAERSKLERELAALLAEVRLLKERITALASTVEHLLRDNKALRESLAERAGTVTGISQARRGRKS
ncbi:MAG: hypothetical protein M0Z95_05605 [Actinomycetota bacterium]|jgi:hypothetical protein|nr:hypothetical protein [Actinomycetota bacterium]